MVEIMIQNNGAIYAPTVEEDIQLELERKGSPGKLTFTVLKDDLLRFTEGNAVMLKVDGVKMFYGFVFTRKRDKAGLVKVTAYDQLRYLKNKDTYVYENKTASSLIQMIASDFRLNTGHIEDTGFVIGSRVEDNKTLFDIIQTALDLTLQNRGQMYVLYDDYGSLCLRNVESMLLNLLMDAETGQNYEYTSSIDGETYDKIKLVYENEETGKREVYIAQDSAHINEWGVLQYFESIKDNANGSVVADSLLDLYNQKAQNLMIRGAFGDARVRAGSSVVVKLDLDDRSLGNYMMVEKVKHFFRADEHTMDLTLRGGGFSV